MPSANHSAHPVDPLQRRAAELRDELRRHAELYHLKDAPAISDADYDRLFKELWALETEHPELQTEDSPTRLVAPPAGAQFKKVSHAEPLLGLQNAFTEEELRA